MWNSGQLGALLCHLTVVSLQQPCCIKRLAVYGYLTLLYVVPMASNPFDTVCIHHEIMSESVDP
jgi:hypothetical protein